MVKKKTKLSLRDWLSISFSLIALILSTLSIYIQFFYEKTNLQVGDVYLSSFRDINDTTYSKINVRLLLLNTGTNPVAFTQWASFLSADGSLPNGAYFNKNISYVNPSIYTNIGENIDEIIASNSVKYSDLNLFISNDKLYNFIKTNENDLDGKNPYLHLGIKITFVDSNGKHTTKEIIIGDVQFNIKHIMLRNTQPKELKIY